MDKQLFSVKKFTEFGQDFYYAVDLPETNAAVPFDFFRNEKGIYGQFARIEKLGDDTYEGVRDPLGIGKVFYTADERQKLRFDEQFRKLLPTGGRVYALPRGQVVRLAASGTRCLINNIAPDGSGRPDFSDFQVTCPKDFLDNPKGQLFQKMLSDRMDVAFSLFKHLEENGFRFFIAMSGGLDSSIIAAAARKHLAHPTACTLDLGASEDAEKSALISEVIDIERAVFETGEQEISAALDASPIACQDYRDFNVHCAALNLLLAKNIQKLAADRGIASKKSVVLTGDIMNELTCDYHAEEIDGTTYYRLPRVNPKMLQRMLVGGLDTSDRELLPFRSYGLSCIQPYAIAYDLYTSLPESLFEFEDIKRVLNGHLVPPKVLELLPKTKLRAQVGSKENMGVLGLCHRNGINEKDFLEKLLGPQRAKKENVPITMGRYEVETFNSTCL